MYNVSLEICINSGDTQFMPVCVDSIGTILLCLFYPSALLTPTMNILLEYIDKQCLMLLPAYYTQA